MMHFAHEPCYLLLTMFHLMMAQVNNMVILTKFKEHSHNFLKKMVNKYPNTGAVFTIQVYKLGTFDGQSKG